MSLIDREASPQETDLVEQFAQALDASVPELTDLRYLLKGEIIQLRLDLVRRFWLKPKVEKIWEKEGIRGLLKIVGGMMGKYENAMLAAHYQALEQYPPDRSGALIGSTAARTGSPRRGKRAARRNSFCFTIARTFYPAMERPPKQRTRSPVSAQAFSGANPSPLCSSCCCSFIWASA